jgi:DNA-binding IscR family transcriptional regulator
MRIGKRGEYALLFTLYVARAGRATVSSAAKSLALSPSFLEQVARNLRMADILKVVRGPGGGYELIGTPTIGGVLKAVGVGQLMSVSDTVHNARSPMTEHRALAHIVGGISWKLNEAMRVPITEAGAQLVRSEVEQMNSVDDTRSN